ncbi:MAG: MFS transporter, partial [Desulfobacterales bacterium]|nr:MFS transporter [Desulfobacterales bacterium]
SIAGRLVMGAASDRIGNKTALLICFLLFFLCLVWLLFARELWMLHVFAVIYGFAHGGFFALSSPTVAGLFGSGSHGVIFGALIFISTIGGALGPVVAGHIFDATGSYSFVFRILTGLSVLGLLAVISLRPVKRVI